TAQRLQQEGWFDEEGWEVDRYKAGDGRWFRDKVFLGTGHKWGQEAWGNAYARWQRHGELNGLWMTDAERPQLEEPANTYRKRRAAYDLGTPPSPEELQEDPRLAEAFEAFRQLMYLQQNWTMTNFRHWLYLTEAEKEEKAVQAQKLLHDADRQRRVDKLNPE